MTSDNIAVTERADSSIRSGDFTFHLIQDGYYRLDGGSMYGMVPKSIWQQHEKQDEKNRLYMALNCLLAVRGDKVYLADTGIGEKLDDKGKKIFGIENEKNLIAGMAEAGITPEMVTHVIPTHLHFDHAGWIMDNRGKLAFPNAGYYIQADEWKEALNPHVRFKDSYLMNYYGALIDSPNLRLIDGDTVIDDGVSVIKTAGHSRGHQVVLFDTGEMKIAHFGDMCAMAAQIRLNWTCGFDRYPEETITRKEPLLKRALDENWLIVTGHDRNIILGRIGFEKGRYMLEKVL